MTSFAGFGKKKLTKIAITDRETQFLELDATLSTTHESSSTITEHPVEQGSNVTDHIRDEPDTLQIDGVVSNTPVLAFGNLRAKPSVPGGNPQTRSEDAYEFLRGIKKRGERVIATTKLRNYVSMAIERLGVTRDVTTSNIVQLRLGLKEIVIARTETAEPEEPTNASRQSLGNNGKKQKTPAGTKAAEKSQTLLFSLLGG